MFDNHVVIMAGGIGSRFWPLSTPEFPKQFIDILGCGRTLIQLTYDRFKEICPDGNFWVVTNAKYVGIVKDQLPMIPENHILAEPAARNTAPCIAWACWCIKKENPDANVVVTPSDAVVMDQGEFKRVISDSLSFTKDREAIVTIGIKPSRPEVGYGYVQTADIESGEIYKVAAFKEKPDSQTARGYLAAGNYFWNAGIFVWNVNTITSSIRLYKPNIAADMDRIVPENGNSAEAVEEVFPQCESISIDFAVMEFAAADGKVYSHPVDFGWSDLGNWSSLHDELSKDGNNNGVVGNVHLYECKDCVVHVEEARKVVAQGLDGYIVSEKNGQILICRRSEEQRIKDFSQK